MSCWRRLGGAKDACLFPVVAFKSKYDVLSINIAADAFPQRPMAFNTGWRARIFAQYLHFCTSKASKLSTEHPADLLPSLPSSPSPRGEALRLVVESKASDEQVAERAVFVLLY